MLDIYNSKHNKRAFTLVEVMLLLVVLSLVFASSVSLITRKHKLKPRRSVHGQYICFREPGTGVLRQVKYSGKSLLQDQSGIEKCTFEAPSNSSYMYIMLVGAGGAGGNANHKSKTSDFYEGPKYIDFLKNLKAESKDYHWDQDGSIEVPGITDADVRNSATWSYTPTDKDGTPIVTKSKSVPFSLLAFRKILRDNNVKIFAYDYTGDGEQGGGMQYGLFSRNNDDGDDKDNWYLSSCVKHGDSGTVESAENCLKYMVRKHSDLIDKSKCVLRKPISKNCPLLNDFFEPVIGIWQTDEHGVEKYDKLSCPGYTAQEGKLIFTRARDFDTNISYANGARWRYDSTGNPNIIDWGYIHNPLEEVFANDCLIGVTRDNPLTYTNGVFMNYDERTSLNITDYNGGKAWDASNKDSENMLQTGFDNGKQIRDYLENKISQRVFKTYPSVTNLKYRKYSQWGKNKGTSCEEGRGDGKIAGGDGKSGGLPFFNDGNKGIKICVSSSCAYEAFSSYNGGSTVSGSANGGKGRAITEDSEVLDFTNFLYKKGNATTCATIDDVNARTREKLRTLSEFDHPGEYGNPYFSCTGRVGFSYSNSDIPSTEKTNYSYLLRINPQNDSWWTGKYWVKKDTYTTDWERGKTDKYSYRCPAVEKLSDNQMGMTYARDAQVRNKNVNNSIGLKISHYVSRSILHHGDHGSAGESKTLFARSFGSADITMIPGVEGKKKDIVSADAPDDERKLTAGNGQRSLFGIDCETLDDGELKCAYQLVAKGGAGGASFVEETPGFVALSKKDIYDYATGRKTTAPDKYSDSYEDGTYQGEESDFQKIAYLSDFPGVEETVNDILKKLGKGGDGGYVYHKCWLQPQYFKYHYKNWNFGNLHGEEYGLFPKSAGYTFDDWVKDNSDWGITIPNVPGSYGSGIGASYEGYTAFTESIINSIGACKAGGKEPKDQFEETQGTDGYPGAIVIMW